MRVRAVAASAAGALVGVGCAGGLLLWGPWTTPGGQGPSATPEELLTRWMAWAAMALCGWLTLGSLLAIGAALPGVVGAICADLARRVTPRLLQRAAAAVLGTTVATVSLPMGTAQGAGIVREAGSPGVGTTLGGSSGAAGGRTHRTGDGLVDPSFTPTAPRSEVAGIGSSAAPAAVAAAPVPAATPTAAPSAPRAKPAPPRAAPAAPDPGWRPTEPARSLHAEESRVMVQSPRPRPAADDAVTVRRGDTLWHIAARHLGPGASDAEISLEWPRWYAANRGLIGPDPDRLLPGQQLLAPVDGGSR